MKELSFLMYTSKEENISVNVVVKDETIWLTQKAMAELFGVGIPAISKHLKNIFLTQFHFHISCMKIKKQS